MSPAVWHEADARVVRDVRPALHQAEFDARAARSALGRAVADGFRPDADVEEVEQAVFAAEERLDEAERRVRRLTAVIDTIGYAARR